MASCFDLLVPELANLSYECVTLGLLSVDAADPHNASAALDAQLIHLELSHLVERGKDILLVLHSYAGIPGSGAAQGLDVVGRVRTGKQGGVIGLVGIAAILANAGETCLEKIGRYLSVLVGLRCTSLSDLSAESLKSSLNLHQATSGLTTVVSDPATIFYNDVEPEMANDAKKVLALQAGAIFVTPAPEPAWADPSFAARLAYIRCQKDQCVPTFAQDMMLQQSGVPWMVHDLECGHCSMIGKPKEVAAALHSFATQFSNLGKSQ